MSQDRIHRAVSADGTEIAGRVHGQGPPLVLFQGGMGDGDLNWGALAPRLADHYTCYLPSTRGRGLSGDNPDLSPPRHEEDATAFVDSIGKPVFVAAWSGGDIAALGAAVHSDAVTAVALYEPATNPMMREEDLADLGAMSQQAGAAAADGRLADAARAIHQCLCNDDELAALDTEYYERLGATVPAVLEALQQEDSYDGPVSTDPEVLARVTMPVLLLLGEQTLRATWFTDAVRHAAEHVPDPHVRKLPGVGHWAPLVAPEPVADALVSFFGSVRQPA